MDIIEYNNTTLQKLEDCLSNTSTVSNNIIYYNLKTGNCGGQVFNGATMNTTAYSVTIPSGSTGLSSFITKTYTPTSTVVGKDVTIYVGVTKPTEGDWNNHWSYYLKHGETYITATNTIQLSSTKSIFIYTVPNVQNALTFVLQNVNATDTTNQRVFGVEDIFFKCNTTAYYNKGNTNTLFAILDSNNTDLKASFGNDIDNKSIYSSVKIGNCDGQGLSGATIDVSNWNINVPIGSTGLYSYIAKTISSTGVIGKNLKIIITVTRPSSLSSWGYYFSVVFKHGNITISPTTVSDVNTLTKKYVFDVINVQNDMSLTYQNTLAMDTSTVRSFGVLSMDISVYGTSVVSNNTDNLAMALLVNNNSLKAELGIGAIKVNTIKVKKDGSGDFTNPYLATELIKTLGTSTYIYNIELYDDEYDIISYLPSAMVTNPSNSLGNRGWEIPSYVNIIGKTINKCHIIGQLPDTCTYAQSEALATINIAQNSNLENLYITAKNMRYAVHDESSGYYKDWTRSVKNCKVEHLGNASGLWLYQGAWGEGCSSGSQSTFENCEFIGNAYGCGWSTHNQANFTKPSYHKFIGCKFSNSNPSTGVAFRLGSCGSTQSDLVDIIGCQLPDITICEETGFSGIGIDFTVKGYGNSFPIYTVSNTTTKFYSFVEETIELYNTDTTTITKGTLVKLDKSNSVKKITSSDSANVVYGVAVVDIAVGSKGLIKNDGYINLSEIGVTANVGDKIGLVNGVATVVTSGDYFAKVNYSGYAKFV